MSSRKWARRPTDTAPLKAHPPSDQAKQQTPLFRPGVNEELERIKARLRKSGKGLG